MRKKSIIGFPKYYICNNGDVINKKSNRIKKPNLGNRGYYLIQLYNDEGMSSFKISRLVAIHFVPNPKNLPEVNHEDGNKLNNWDWNLKWCTHQYNMNHARSVGLWRPEISGKLSYMGMPNKKLNADKIKDIRLSNRSAKDLSIKYNVTVQTIYKVINNKSWSNVK